MQAEPPVEGQQRAAGHRDPGPGRAQVRVVGGDDSREPVHAAAEEEHHQRAPRSLQPERGASGRQLRAEGGDARRPGTGEEPPPREPAAPQVGTVVAVGLDAGGAGPQHRFGGVGAEAADVRALGVQGQRGAVVGHGSAPHLSEKYGESSTRAIAPIASSLAT